MFTHTVYRKEQLNLKGLSIDRTAVRAVILHGREVLMVYSANVGDYKFPGGGIQKEETHSQALTREVLEEVGARVTSIDELLGQVTEYDRPQEPEFQLFKMISYYYRVAIEDQLGSQNLEDYEKELGFEPVWVEVDEAIHCNTEILKNPALKMPFWTRRELYVLQELKKSFL